MFICKDSWWVKHECIINLGCSQCLFSAIIKGNGKKYHWVLLRKSMWKQSHPSIHPSRLTDWLIDLFCHMNAFVSWFSSVWLCIISSACMFEAHRGVSKLHFSPPSTLSFNIVDAGQFFLIIMVVYFNDCFLGDGNWY